jgi:class 3 adenylate cyclase
MANARPAPSEPERRQATILFADIAGFTSLSEKSDPEEIAQLLDRFFSVAGKVISDHGGTIDKFIGDSVMALFGAPAALEQASRKAIEAALELRRQLHPLQIHIGINTGTVVSGGIGSEDRKDFTVLGDAVNLASRLEGVAKAGQIVVGPLTWRSERDRFHFREMKPVAVKGKADLVSVWEVLGDQSECRDSPGSDGRAIHSTLVGRDAELDQLWSQAAKLLAGQGSVVCLVGEAGIGKSRLCADFRASEIAKRTTVLEGRALSSGRNLSYWPIIEVVRGWASVAGEDSEEVALDKLEAAVRAVAPDRCEEVVAYLEVLLGLRPRGEGARIVEGTSGETKAKLIARSCRELVAAAAGFRPLIFIVEDLHWADESTLEILKSLVGTVTDTQVMFLLVFRPGFGSTLEAFRQAVAERCPGRLVTIDLPPLGDREAGVLIRNLLRTQGFPEAVLERIVRHSEGNPFFIEEALRSFIDSGAIRIEAGEFTVGPGAEDLEVPTSISEVILSRFDRMDEGVKEILRVASVIGRSFFGRVLAQVVDDPGGLNSRIEDLQGLQLVRERQRLGELEYLFKHVLVQETIYRSLLLRKRKDLHLRVARAIEQCFGDRIREFLGMLAWHYSRAEEPEKAAELLERAGRAALETGASAEALAYYGEALALYRQRAGTKASPERLAGFERVLAKSSMNRGYLAEVDRHYTLALSTLGKPIARGLGLYWQAGFGLVRLLALLYLPALRSRKKASPQDGLVADLHFEFAISRALVDPTAMVLRGLVSYNERLKRDLYQTPGTAVHLALFSAFFSGMGFFGVAQRTLDLAERLPGVPEERPWLEVGRQWYAFMGGRKPFAFGLSTGSALMKQGEFTWAQLAFVFEGLALACCGRFAEADTLASRLATLADEYDMPIFTSLCLETRILVRYYRRDGDPISEIDDLIGRTDHLAIESLRKTYRGLKLEALVQLGRLALAAPVVSEIRALLANEKMLLAENTVPVLGALVHWGAVAVLTEPRPARRKDLIRRTRPALLRLLRMAPGFAYRQPWALRIAGLWFWAAGRRRRAVALWTQGLAVGRKLALEPEVGRLCREAAGHGCSLGGK